MPFPVVCFQEVLRFVNNVTSPTFAVEGVCSGQVVYFQQGNRQGLHYILGWTGLAVTVSASLIRGGGCDGSDRWSWWSRSICSGSGWV